MKRWIMYMFTCICVMSLANAQTSPQIELANKYHANIPISDYLVSEKFDGVRAIWDGQQLLTKSGNNIAVPQWFVASFGRLPLEGELWSGYGEFAFVSQVVRSSQSRDSDWRKIKYLVFDSPNKTQSFFQRYQSYKRNVANMGVEHVKAITQWQFYNDQQLNDFYQHVLSRQGEGVMLHQKEALHIAGRSDRVLKYKPYQDAEAIVLGYSPGRGKYQGMMGALKVVNEQGINFKIGTGFSDELRSNPPPIGTQVTYRHQGFTKYGKPRFARFLRVRDKL
ncbi:ATP-dependent DNA ligase [Pseudoalteromonas sp. A25]|uniref:DNA ligase n=1 Tax=Pseudoalteromonas sp. A25 TaxID=116092 RepID=UPI001260DDFB|nr:DNA ligase [Pseudoalteromonas sp. A25]BBN80832.1 ATP-dependent DNA ligase [Pseudoalteromonas sp. A25]